MEELHSCPRVGGKSAPGPGEDAAMELEGGPNTGAHSSAGQSSLLDKELKVRVRGGSDRGQRLSGFWSPTQVLPHTISPLCLLLQTNQVMKLTVVQSHLELFGEKKKL